MKAFFRAAFALAVLSLPTFVSAAEIVAEVAKCCCGASCPGCC